MMSENEPAKGGEYTLGSLSKDILPPPTVAEQNAKKREESRQIIAYIVVISYVILLAINIALPIFLFMRFKSPEQTIEIDQIKELMLAISSVLSGLVGVLGFVVGYYFKSLEDEKKYGKPIKR